MQGYPHEFSVIGEHYAGRLLLSGGDLLGGVLVNGIAQAFRFFAEGVLEAIQEFLAQRGLVFAELVELRGPFHALEQREFLLPESLLSGECRRSEGVCFSGECHAVVFAIQEVLNAPDEFCAAAQGVSRLPFSESGALYVDELAEFV